MQISTAIFLQEKKDIRYRLVSATVPFQVSWFIITYTTLAVKDATVKHIQDAI